MKDDFILTQTKKVVMTHNKTVTFFTETLEKVDEKGNKTVLGSKGGRTESKNTICKESRRAA